MNHPRHGSSRVGVRIVAVCAMAVCVIASLLRHPDARAASRATSCHGPIAAAMLGNLLLVAELDGHSLAILETPSGTMLHRVALSGSANGVCAGPGNLALVACGARDGTLCLVDVKQARVTGIIPAGHTPMSPVMDADGKLVWLCLRFENAVVAVDLASRKVRTRISVGREPIACALTADGKTLIVAHHLPEQAATAPVVAATLAFVDVAGSRVVSLLTLPNGSSSVRGLCLSPDGAYAYVSHILSHFQYPTTQVDRGWMNTNAVSIIDVNKHALVNTVLLDTTTQGSANPWGVTCTADGHWLAVTCAGTHEVVAIDRPALQQRLEDAAAGDRAGGTSPGSSPVRNDLDFLHGISRHIPLPGNGPRGLVSAGTRLWAPLYFTDNLASLDLSDTHPAVTLLSLGPQAGETPARAGERLFNDAGNCYQHWQSCATCHPDGRVDALNWDLLNDGIGNPKNTKSLLFAPQTPPMMWLGIRDADTTAIRTGFRYIQFHPVSGPDADAVSAYLAAMQPVPGPNRANSPAARRGKAVFAAADCARCHHGPYYTDLKLYDVGTGPDLTTNTSAFVTPPLCELWRTAPYLHDGRAATLKELFTLYNPHDQHGVTSHLSPRDLDALVEYLQTL